MTSPRQHNPPTHRIPVYDIRLVRSRRPLRLAEVSLADSRQSASALHHLIGLTDREHLACLFLDGALHVTGAHIVAVGGQQGIGAVDPRVLLRAALVACAHAFVLGHNHPSGIAHPSSEDLATTSAIASAADIIGIPLLDHVIVTRDPARFYSMKDRGTL